MGADPDAGSVVGPGRCPACGGTLGEPISGDVHCYVTCRSCGARYELDDPGLIAPST